MLWWRNWPYGLRQKPIDFGDCLSQRLSQYGKFLALPTPGITPGHAAQDLVMERFAEWNNSIVFKHFPGGKSEDWRMFRQAIASFVSASLNNPKRTIR